MPAHDIKSGAALRKLFPYMFDKPNTGFSFYRGWMLITAKCCIEIDHLLGENRELFHWVQIKEKYGAARLYYSFADQTAIRLDARLPDAMLQAWEFPAGNMPLGAAIGRLVAAAEKATAETCMICGCAAQPQRYENYFLTLCANHHPQSFHSLEEHPANYVLRIADADFPVSNGAK
ncbi:hypothetical protein [Polaromonas sp. JS666]|uniref:hypothetical protein n=1 Tax=Polaromonas sp. (strain JS666 / ATCC BAA-500) TaxID=296591 RepID=UPI000046469C|nr:hypothetical protein [Polaromonas sp. JS666]ABE47190.1 hypothetical protein Bpro_5334 [Polaromonas sp. JS666]